MNNNNIKNRIGVSPTKESVAMLYSPHEHYFSMIVNKLQKIPLQYSNKRTTNHYKQTKSTPMKTIPILKLQMMKNCILLLLLLLAGSSNAQIVNIPDANFKAKLIMANPNFQIAKDAQGNTIAIDINADGQIQETEAQTVYELNLSLFGSSFTDMTGILAFTNLKNLNFSGNYVVNLNLNGLNLESLDCGFCNFSLLNLSIFPNLKNLRCGSNNISILDLSQVPLLETLTCRFNQIYTLDLQFVPNLHYLDCQNNHISNLNLSATPNMDYLLCDDNQLSNIDLSNVVNLQMLGCGYNPISSLNLSNVPLLENLSFSNCLVTSLDLSNVPILKFLTFPFNQISTIDLSNLTELKALWCYNNLFTSLNINSNLNLEQLICNHNQIANIILNNPSPNLTVLDFSNNLISSFNFVNTPNLTNLTCNNNLLTSLDLSNLFNIYQVDCSYNNLIEMSIKNGILESSLNFSNNPNLVFICADDQQVVSIQAQLNDLSMNSTVCNSYCSFVMGGNHYTISGMVTFDNNNNGCDSNDLHFPLIKFKINDGYIDLGASVTNSNGIYTFYTLLASNYIFPDVENPNWFNFSPNSANVILLNNINTSTQDFCISANGTHNDVEVVLSPIGGARPGFDVHYKLVYKNKGNQTLSGNLALTFDDAHTDFVVANPVGSQTANVLQWSYNNLLPFETRVIQLTLHLNSPLDTPALNSGDILDFTASITPVVNDDLPADNAFVLHQTVVNSFDPNDIQCLEGSTVLPTEIGKYLHYAVQFENTGTAAAENIVVKDIIDTTKYDMDSLQLLDASAPVYARITGNVVEFIFKNIQLSPATGNPPVGGHGDILFKIKSKNTLVTGNTVEKQAKIYFDYNAPINTNIAQTTFAELSNTEFTKDDSITVSPNPTHAIITINGNSAIKSITLYDVQGRILETVLNNNTIDLADKTNGIYFLKITSEKGSKVEKVVKE